MNIKLSSTLFAAASFCFFSALTPKPVEAATNIATLQEENQALIACSAKIREALLNGKNSITIDDYSFTYNSEDGIFETIYYYCPYVDGSNISIQTIYSPVNGKYYRINIRNSLGSAETVNWVNSIDAKISQLSDLIDQDSYSTLDKALILHDYMDANYYYDTSFASVYPSQMLTQNIGVCQSYAYLFQHIMTINGEECYTQISDEMNHAWNSLKVGSDYYHLDITWDDVVPDYYGQSFHNYFLLSDATIADSKHSHSGWNLTVLKANDTSYEDDYFLDAVSPIIYEGDDRYFIDSSGLVKYNTASKSKTKLASSYSWGYTAQFSGLVRHGDVLYFNNKTSILAYDLSTNTLSTYASPSLASGSGIYGCRKEGALLYYAVQEGYNVEYENKQIHSIQLPHVHSYVATVFAPTCTNKGYTLYTCTECQDSYVDSEVPALGHTYAVETLFPTCTQCGCDKHTCTRCNSSYTDKETSPLGHQWDAGKVTKKATTTSEGVYTYTCTVCGATRTTAIAMLPSSEDDSSPSISTQDTNQTTSGEIYLINQVTYTITGTNQVEFTSSNPKASSVTIPSTVTINGRNYKVTSIAANAFKNNKKLKTLVIGKNIKKIGAYAFYGTKNLKKITVKTKLLKASKIGKNAFQKAGSKNYKKLCVKFPKKLKKTYKKSFYKKGLSKKAKIK